MSENIVITGAARTPMGGFQGVLSAASAVQLGAAAIDAALSRSQLQGDAIDEVIMGCVLPAGQGQAPARQASLGAGLPLATGCTTINKMCGSGMKATMFAHDATMFAHDLLKAGGNRIMLAGGFESMSNAPYLLTKARTGMRMGHGQVFDHMFLDGLEDAYDKGKLMGVFAENTADKYGFTREQQDEFALCRRNYRGRDKDAQGRDYGRYRRTAVQCKYRQDPEPAPRLPFRWHRHRGEFELDLGWRRRTRTDG